MGYRITVIPGDGIGPEIVRAMQRCLEALGLDITWDTALAGEPALNKHKSLLPEETLEAIRANKVAIKGPITTPVGSGFRSINVAIRQALHLYACLRPAKSIPGLNTRYENVDIIVVRENTEDLYKGVEFEQGHPDTLALIEMIEKYSGNKILRDSAITIKPISLTASRNIARFAFDLAAREKRGKVTCIHKANIQKATDGLFLHTFQDVARNYGGLESGDLIVDNFCMQAVKNPGLFDVLVLPNLYGDIISDLCAGLVGGLGVAPGANIGDNVAVFEPVHGSAPKYAGMNKVNPTATILSGVMMLRYLGEMEKAAVLEKAVHEVIKEGVSVTYDLKPDRNDPTAVGTSQMTDAIIEKINAKR